MTGKMKDLNISMLNDYADQKAMVRVEVELEDIPCTSCSASGANRCNKLCEEKRCKK